MEALLVVPHQDAENFAPALCTQRKAAHITGRSRRTVQRWVRLRRVSDVAALRLLQNVLHGELQPPWQGWRIAGEYLVDGGNGERWRVADLRAASINAQLVTHQRRRLAELERDCKALRAALAEKPAQRLLRAASALRGRI